jgi:hypothetical protein
MAIMTHIPQLQATARPVSTICRTIRLTAKFLACMVWCTAWLLSSCNEEEIYTLLSSEQNTETTLHFTLSVPETKAPTRGISYDPQNDNKTWSDWEKLIDGRYLYRVTVLLVDANNKLVGYKDWNDEIKSSTNTTELSTTFTGIPSGNTYTMYALANYSAISANDGGTTQTYNGLNNFPNITGLSVGSNVSTLITNLKNYKLDAGTDLIAPKQPQPLTLVKEITLPANYDNYAVSGELIRTYARLRVVVANRTTSYSINLTDFTFKNGFTTNMQRYEQLLTPTFNNTGSIASYLNSTDAITPYSGSKTIESNKSSVVFDGYFHETQCTNGYGYSLTVNCNLPTQSSSYQIGGQSITKYSELKEGYYLISTGTKYLKSDGNSITTTSSNISSNLSENTDCIWYLEKVEGQSNQYYIRSADGDKFYISRNYTTANLNNTKTAITTTDGTNGIILKGGINYYFLYDNTSLGKIEFNFDKSTPFTFTPVTIAQSGSGSTTTSSKTVTVSQISAISSGSTQSAVLKGIGRNEFLNVVINVLYNENWGTLEFVVDEWENTDMGITFN